MALERPVDRAWVNGNVFTGTKFAEALLVENGTVGAIGTRDAVLRAKGSGTEVTDLRGRLLIPGLIDLHMHLGDTTLLREGVELHGARSIRELLERVQARIDAGAPGPLFGFGWDQENLEEKRYPTRTDIDRVLADRPVLLYRVCTHAAVLNSAALEALGLNESTPDPRGGSLGRDSQGQLNGLLFEEALRAAEKTTEEWVVGHVDAVGRTLAHAAALGLTTVGPVSASPAEIRAVDSLARTRRMPVRVRCYLDLRRLSELSQLPSSDPEVGWRIVGVKAVIDGALGVRTAWLSDAYADAPGERGYPLWSETALVEALQAASDRGLPPALHAIGDRALQWTLDVLVRVRAASTPRIEHASVTTPAVLDLLRRSRPALVVQPHFVETDSWVPTRLGVERARGTYAFRTLLDAGLLVAGSSDSPVEPLDPWTGLRAAVFRAPRSDFGRLTSGERLAPLEAFQLYTRNAGAILQERGIGELIPEGPADFVLLSASTLDGALVAGRPPVVGTWVGGRQAAGAPAA